jgi:Flp pilus assembly pilin Flp
MSTLIRFLRDDSAPTLAEYAMALAVLIVAGAAVYVLAGRIANSFNNAAGQLP